MSRYTAPNLDQLSSFAAVRVLGPFYSPAHRQAIRDLLERHSYFREAWERHHREFQEGLNSADVRQQEGDG